MDILKKLKLKLLLVPIIMNKVVFCSNVSVNHVQPPKTNLALKRSIKSDTDTKDNNSTQIGHKRIFVDAILSSGDSLEVGNSKRIFEEEREQTASISIDYITQDKMSIVDMILRVKKNAAMESWRSCLINTNCDETQQREQCIEIIIKKIKNYVLEESARIYYLILLEVDRLSELDDCNDENWNQILTSLGQPNFSFEKCLNFFDEVRISCLVDGSHSQRKKKFDELLELSLAKAKRLITSADLTVDKMQKSINLSGLNHEILGQLAEFLTQEDSFKLYEYISIAILHKMSVKIWDFYRISRSGATIILNKWTKLFVMYNKRQKSKLNKALSQLVEELGIHRLPLGMLNDDERLLKLAWKRELRTILDYLEAPRIIKPLLFNKLAKKPIKLFYIM